MSSFAGVIIPLIFYIAKRRGENKRRARNLAESIRLEIGFIQEMLDDTTRTAIRIRPLTTIDKLPADIYDGLLKSATISHFDVDLQDSLHRFYKIFKDKSVDELLVPEDALRVKAVKMSENLDLYIPKHRSRFWFF